MYKAEVISLGMKKDPSYENITEEFLESLDYLDDDNDMSQLESHCAKFIKVLIGIPGPTKICGEWIKKEIEKFGLTISLH